MNKEEINKILDAHKKWLLGTGGNRANIRNSNLWNADMWNTDLRDANLWDAALWDAKIEFCQFPSIKLLSSINLGAISDKLALELMRWDAQCHPNPELFDRWAKSGECPYQNEERFWLFIAKQEVWEPGKPQMTGYELIMAICKEKNWGIKGYLKKK